MCTRYSCSPTEHPSSPEALSHPAHCPPPRAFIFLNLPSAGQKSAFLPSGTRAHLTREGGSYCYLFTLGCHFARSTLFPPDVSCPSALCLICVTVTLAEIQRPFVPDSLWWFLGGWESCGGTLKRVGTQAQNVVPISWKRLGGSTTHF